jgi:hydrogenase nickel incorporation protein HypA/HybF
MHEYAVVDELIRSLIPRLEEHPGDVAEVFLSKGELRILSDRALAHAFDLLKSGTRLESATLVIESVEAEASCASCGYRGSVGRFEDEAGHFSVPILSCPSCGAPVELLSGRELYVDRVTLRESPSDEAAS